MTSMYFFVGFPMCKGVVGFFQVRAKIVPYDYRSSKRPAAVLHNKDNNNKNY